MSDNDIARLAKHFDLSDAEARKKFTYHYLTKDADEVILRHKKDTVYKTICRFFDTDERRCTVYEARPNVCRKYPYGNKCGYYDFLKFERERSLKLPKSFQTSEVFLLLVSARNKSRSQPSTASINGDFHRQDRLAFGQ